MVEMALGFVGSKNALGKLGASGLRERYLRELIR